MDLMRTAIASLICAASLVGALAFGAWALDAGIALPDWLIVWPIVAGYLEQQASRAE